MEVLKKIAGLDRRILYLVLLAVVFLPLVRPIGIPFRISEWTQGFHKAVDDLKSGDIVLMSLDYSIGGAPDVHPQAEIVFTHMMQKGLRVVMVAFVDQGVEFGNQLIASWEAQGKQYGQDFVNLGFAAGTEVAISAFAQDVAAVFPKDVRGNPIGQLPIMQGIKTAADFKFIAQFATGIPGPAEWIRQVQTRYNVPLATGVVTVMGPQTEPYYQSRQLVGLLSGMRSAAEYELAVKRPGKATAAMDAQSMGHLVIILFIVMGNVLYFMEKGRN
jgi:hypothetical protein